LEGTAALGVFDEEGFFCWGLGFLCGGGGVGKGMVGVGEVDGGVRGGERSEWVDGFGRVGGFVEGKGRRARY